MKRSLGLTPKQRAALLDRYRADDDPEVRLRSPILPLLDDRHSWLTVASLLFRGGQAVDRRVKRFHAEGVSGVAGRKPGCPVRFDPSWVAVSLG